jgi:diguanylate cyclase (GGDEF)-like protein
MLMHLHSPAKRFAGRVPLTRQVALLSLVPMVVLGIALAHVLQTQIVDRTLTQESQAARLIARIGIQPRLTPTDLRGGLGASKIGELDSVLKTSSVERDLARIKIWNDHDTVVYSDDHALIGRRLTPSDDLEEALEGDPENAVVVTPEPNSETADEVGLGKLIEVYVPLRFDEHAKPVGAFEMYLSYHPIAGAITRDKRTIALLVAGGLALLWLAIYRIVARASRRLRAQARENHRLARYDQLTRLPNRTLFSERLGSALERSGTTGAADPPTVLMIDLDGFTQINSTLGNANGDRLLVEVATRLQEVVTVPGTTVARLGNDEFAVLARDGAPRELGDAIAAALERPVVIDGITINIEATIGAVIPGSDEDAPAEVLQHVEAALSRARTTGSRMEIYSAAIDRFDPAKLLLLGQLRGALERDELVLHYQPKLDLRTAKVKAVEALLRWQHPERGLLGPGEFIPLVEPTALIDAMTLHVVELAAAQMSEWKRTLHQDLEVSVNLSARNLLDDDLAAKVLGILARYDVPPNQMTIEVTESATMTDPERAICTLRRLRDAGLGISIDDFGTGNASIDYLARLPASELKVDRMFVTEICADARAEAIVRSTIDLACNLELSVVAEGIETQDALDRLAELGCDVAQGYLISRPLAAAEITDWLRARSGGGIAPRTPAPWRRAQRALRPRTSVLP